MPDAYTRRARLFPAGLAATPATVLLAGGAVDPKEIGSVAAIVAGALGIVVCGVVRDLGRRLQPSLWASWGGPPTTRRVRWRNATDPSAVDRLHRRLEAVLDDPLPTRDEELADPVAADRRYDDAIGVLRELTRDRERFPLVFEENAEYGFRRNCLGLRPVALVIATLALMISALLFVLGDGSLSEHLARHGSGAAIAAIAALAWWLLVTPAWVERAAELYADRLLEAIASLRQER